MPRDKKVLAKALGICVCTNQPLPSCPLVHLSTKPDPQNCVCLALLWPRTLQLGSQGAPELSGSWNLLLFMLLLLLLLLPLSFRSTRCTRCCCCRR